MAWIVGDGFDAYSSTADPGAVGSVWDAYNSIPVSFSITNDPDVRFPPGRFVNFLVTSGAIFTKNFANETTLYAALAFQYDRALGPSTPGVYVSFRDGGTAQCTVALRADGSITLGTAADGTGTILATYPGAWAGYVAGIWYHFQFKVVIHPTAGSFTVRRNGATSDSFTATGLNTRNGTANTYANRVVFGSGGTVGVWRVDDICCFSGSGAAPNTWVGDIRSVLMLPAGDAGTPGLTAVPAATSTQGPSFSATTITVLANTCHVRGILFGAGGLLQKTTVQTNAAFTGKLKMAIYLADGTAQGPGTLWAVSPTEQVNPASGATLDFLWPTPIYIRGGAWYWFALLADSASAMRWTSNTGYSSGPDVRDKYVAMPYTGGFLTPMPEPMTIPGGFDLCIQATLLGNSVVVSEGINNADTDYVWSTTVGAADFYVMGRFSPVPVDQVIVTVAKAFVRKTDAGPRNAQVIVKVGATEYPSADMALSTNYGWVYRVDAVNPATGVPWTPEEVVALQLGVRLTL